MYIYNDEDNVPMNKEAFPHNPLMCTEYCRFALLCVKTRAAVDKDPEACPDYAELLFLEEDAYRERVLKHDEYSFKNKEDEEE